MTDLLTTLLKLTKRLYPTGRAFRIPFEKTIEKIHKGLNVSESEAFLGATGILDSILPDNDNFTEQDATDWERRLAIRASSLTSLDDRKLAIARKYASPGDIPARQHFLYQQGQLQAAGFDVFIHENRVSDGMGGFTTIPIDGVIGVNYGSINYGAANYGPSIANQDIIANYIDAERDELFVIPTDLRATYFIGGEVLGTVADIPAERESEFRQLVLTLKPLQTVGILLINYT